AGLVSVLASIGCDARLIRSRLSTAGSAVLERQGRDLSGDSLPVDATFQLQRAHSAGGVNLPSGLEARLHGVDVVRTVFGVLGDESQHRVSFVPVSGGLYPDNCSHIV